MKDVNKEFKPSSWAVDNKTAICNGFYYHCVTIVIACRGKLSKLFRICIQAVSGY